MAINIVNGTSAPQIHGNSQLAVAASSSVEKTRGNQVQGVTAVQGTGELRLTQESRRLQALETSLSKELPVDKARVEALRKAVDSGEYQVDTAKVARQLLNLEGRLFK
jgi:negative regulator of flagellin synthesis FlgM